MIGIFIGFFIFVIGAPCLFMWLVYQGQKSAEEMEKDWWDTKK